MNDRIKPGSDAHLTGRAAALVTDWLCGRFQHVPTTRFAATAAPPTSWRADTVSEREGCIWSVTWRNGFRHKSQAPYEADGLHVAPTERVYAIDDIHGRTDLMDALLERISADISQADTERSPRIIFMGDYIDR